MAAAPRGLDLVDAPAEEPIPAQLVGPVGTVRVPGPCGEAGLERDPDPAQVAEGDVPVHSQGGEAEGPEPGTDRGRNMSNWTQNFGFA